MKIQLLSQQSKKYKMLSQLNQTTSKEFKIFTTRYLELMDVRFVYYKISKGHLNDILSKLVPKTATTSTNEAPLSAATLSKVPEIWSNQRTGAPKNHD